ncbi:LuxR C-terminal-related transcriptional regulator [Streptomyces erythrochromogenes]|uniref:helix-turn-helix transcriptional regulator n=1 Tax=Streptomyces erythrochromogenes TaxID=285574 RepID=UPI003329A177
MASLYERADALALLSCEARRARAGSGRLLLFRGPTGTGRSALLRASICHGADHGMQVLTVSCSPEESGEPLAPLRKMLCPAAGCGQDDDDPAMDPGHRRHADRLWRLLCSRAAEAPLLLAVDDVHLADHASRRWLLDAARRLAALPVLMVVTERVQYDVSPPRPGFSHGLAPSLVRAHTCGPLGRSAAEAMVHEAFGPDTDPAWTQECVAASAGHPLLLRALLDDLRVVAPDGGRSGSALPDTCADLYPGAFVAAVTWWLDSAGHETATVARTLAEVKGCAGRADERDVPGRECLLAAVTGSGPARVLGWSTAMTRLGLLRPDPVQGDLRFAHPLLRDAVLDGWSHERREAVHRAAADFRYRRGDSAEEVAGHLLRTGPVGMPRSAATLLDAAAEATRAGRTGDAADYLRGALDEPLAPGPRAEALVALATLEAATEPSGGIPRLTEALRLRERPRDRVLTAIALGTALTRRGESRAALDLLRGLDGVREDPVLARTVLAASALFAERDPALGRAVHAELGTARGGDGETSAGTRGTAGATGPSGPALQVLRLRYEAAAGLVTAEEALRRLRGLTTAPEDPLAAPYLLGAAACVAQWADALDWADQLAAAGLAGHRVSPLHPAHDLLLHVRIDTAAARGDFARVLTYAEENGLPVDGAGPAAAGSLAARAVLALVRTDRLAEARRLADGVTVTAGSVEDDGEAGRFRYARGVLRAASGDRHGALADFLACGRSRLGGEPAGPAVTPWRSAAAEVQWALGRPREALALADEEYRLATAWGTPRVVGRALRVLGEVTGGRRGLALAEQAVELLRGAPPAPGAVPEPGLGLELAPALVSYGRLLTAAGHPRRARPLLREASVIAERLGAAGLLTLTQDVLRVGGARTGSAPLTGEAALTGSERRVAALAADGRTNAEISDLLHLARRTVETHLTSTYRKLGIQRRADLAGALTMTAMTAMTTAPSRREPGRPGTP